MIRNKRWKAVARLQYPPFPESLHRSVLIRLRAERFFEAGRCLLPKKISYGTETGRRPPLPDNRILENAIEVEAEPADDVSAIISIGKNLRNVYDGAS